MLDQAFLLFQRVKGTIYAKEGMAQVRRGVHLGYCQSSPEKQSPRKCHKRRNSGRVDNCRKIFVNLNIGSILQLWMKSGVRGCPGGEEAV